MVNHCFHTLVGVTRRRYNESYLPLQINNPDKRVVILKDYAKKAFPATPLLDYAIEVEKITTSKVCVIFTTSPKEVEGQLINKY